MHICSVLESDQVVPLHPQSLPVAPVQPVHADADIHVHVYRLVGSLAPCALDVAAELDLVDI